MSLVERFIELDRWPTARKTTLLAALATGFHLIGALGADLMLPLLPWIDKAGFDRILWPWIGCMAIAGLISHMIDRRGHEGRWSSMLIIIPYGLLLIWLQYSFGVASSPLIAWFPMVVLLVTVWYGPKAGIAAMLHGTAVLSLGIYVQSLPGLPFAPLLKTHDMEVQRNPAYGYMLMFILMLVFAFSMTLVILLMQARRLVQQRLDEARVRIDRSARLISRYVPSQLAEKIARGEHTESCRPERTRLTVFFSDIEGFTEASDRLDPEDLADLLDEYLSEMVAIADRHGATINQIVGDGIMAFFGAPQATTDRDHALRAVRMALAMQARMNELKDIWVTRGIQRPLRIRIGINTGHASVGDYGSPGRKLYSAIGVQTNLAARIQARCEPGAILISNSTWALVQDQVPCVDCGELLVKGMRYPVQVYEVLPPDAQPEQQIAAA
jgi:class 3 adenylate cyclase